jgi:hypothetical protein
MGLRGQLGLGIELGKWSENPREANFGDNRKLFLRGWAAQYQSHENFIFRQRHTNIYSTLIELSFQLVLTKKPQRLCLRTGNVRVIDFSGKLHGVEAS